MMAALAPPGAPVCIVSANATVEPPGTRAFCPSGADAQAVRIWVPGKPTNPKNLRGLGHWKHRRLIRAARDKAALAMLDASGPSRSWPWPADAPKLVRFTAHLPRLLDSDNLVYACSPIRDALGDVAILGKTPGTAKGPGRVKDGPRDGHAFSYTQRLAKGGPVGVEVLVRLLTAADGPGGEVQIATTNAAGPPGSKRRPARESQGLPGPRRGS